MFAKLSALALCLSLASALQIVAPASVEVGGSATLHIYDISADGPSNIQLLLIGPNVHSVLATDEPVNATMYASIPYRISASPYYLIAAADPEETNIIYAESGYMAIVEP